MIDIDKEWEPIRIMSMRHGVDPLLVLSIRISENGGQGREFGIVSKSAPDYATQLHLCVNTVRGLLAQCPNPFIEVMSGVHKYLKYTESFIANLARHYAPIGVSNDPTGLNTNWRMNVSSTYSNLVTKGFTDQGQPIGDLNVGNTQTTMA